MDKVLNVSLLALWVLLFFRLGISRSYGSGDPFYKDYEMNREKYEAMEEILERLVHLSWHGDDAAEIILELSDIAEEAEEVLKL